MSYFGLTFGEYPGNWWGTAVIPPEPLVVLPAGDGVNRKRKPRRRDWEQERRNAEALRKFLERLLEPVQASADVVTTTDVVAVLPERGEQIALPVPPTFNAAEVTQAVMAVLQARAISVQRVTTESARRQAAAIMDAARQESERRLRRRRREEEILLLM